MTAAGTTRVWDLADSSRDRAVRRRGFDVGGPVAAVLGVVALGAAIAPGLPDEARWGVVIAAGVVALLVGFSALRRRQALTSLLLALTGLVAPVAAGAVTMDSSLRAPAAVTSSVVADSTLVAPIDTIVPTASFLSLPTIDQTDARGFATGLVLRLRTLHGSFGPYPTSLTLSTGSVVEGAGMLQGTAIGVVPAHARLVYEVTSSGSAFRITVVSTSDPSASITASSALVVPGSD